MLGRARGDGDIRRGAEGEDELVIVHLLADRGPVVPHCHAAPPKIDGLDVHLAELDAPGAAQRADRVQDVARLDSSRRSFSQHRREQEEVLVTDQSDVYRKQAGAAPG